MRILHIWITLGNGINIINFDIDYEKKEVFGNTSYEVKVTNRNLNIKEMIDIGFIAQFLQFLEVKFNKIYEEFSMNDLLFVKYRERIHHIQEDLLLEYSVISVAQRDLTIDLRDESRVLKQFSKVISFEFYDKFSKQIEILMKAGNISKFNGFTDTCKDIILNIDKIDSEYEKRAEMKEEMKQQQLTVFEL